jgi:hypothetical protein
VTGIRLAVGMVVAVVLFEGTGSSLFPMDQPHGAIIRAVGGSVQLWNESGSITTSRSRS